MFDVASEIELKKKLSDVDNDYPQECRSLASHSIHSKQLVMVVYGTSWGELRYGPQRRVITASNKAIIETSRRHIFIMNMVWNFAGNLDSMFDSIQSIFESHWFQWPTFYYEYP